MYSHSPPRSRFDMCGEGLDLGAPPRLEDACALPAVEGGPRPTASLSALNGRCQHCQMTVLAPSVRR